MILDDALHYLRERGLVANHNTVDLDRPNAVKSPAHKKISNVCLFPSLTDGLGDDSAYETDQSRAESLVDDVGTVSAVSPRLLVMTSKNIVSLRETIQLHKEYIQGCYAAKNEPGNFIRDYAYTLARRAANFDCRTFAVVQPSNEIDIGPHLLSNIQTAVSRPSLCFVFTGQGAQYPAHVLKPLEQYRAYGASLRAAGKHLKRLGCLWDLRG